MSTFATPEHKALFQLRRTSNHRRAICANYARFADLKQQWIDANPDATPAQYDAAIQRIARECGV